MTLYRNGGPEQVWMNLDYSPVPDESGNPAGVLAIVVETTEKVLAERARTFRFALEERLRGLSDPAAMMEATTDLIAGHLRGAQVGIGEVDDSQEYIAVRYGWNDWQVTSVAGTWQLSRVGFVLPAEMMSGATIAISDVCEDPRTSNRQVIAAYEGIAARAILIVPLVRDGRVMAILFIHCPEPRIWTCEEVSLVEEASSRLWAAVERARAEIRLRESEERLRELNETLEQRVEARTTKLAESERRFRAIFDTAFQLTALSTLDGSIIVVNRAALDAAQATQEQVAGMKMWDAPWWAPSPEEARRIQEGVARVAAGEFVRYESELILPEGARNFDFSMKPVLDETRKPVFLVAEGRDITELKQAEAALRQAQKMEAVGQLTGGIAHDFNNLLGALVGSLDLIRRKPDDVERVRRFAEAGLQAAERGAKLTGQLLAFSRAQRIELKPLIVAQLVSDMRDLLARTLGPMVRVQLKLKDGATPVLSDVTQLEMAVLNLAINARDAMPNGGDLTIATALRRIEKDRELSRGDYVELAVSDTGEGMSPEVAGRAFDPFFTTKGVGKGTGLGLSQVYGIARQAGGTVRIESLPGQGTTVRILLPRTDAAPRAAADGGAEDPAATESAATILIVDDDQDILRVLIDAVDSLGYRVLKASDGPSGLAALAKGNPDLMMVDFAMPGMNGAELARAARKQRPDLPIVFASGYADTEAIEAVAGQNAFVLRKPFRVEELRAVLHEAMNGRS